MFWSTWWRDSSPLGGCMPGRQATPWFSGFDFGSEGKEDFLWRWCSSKDPVSTKAKEAKNLRFWEEEEGWKKEEKEKEGKERRRGRRRAWRLKLVAWSLGGWWWLGFVADKCTLSWRLDTRRQSWVWKDYTLKANRNVVFRRDFLLYPKPSVLT